jgi:small-conductance mechanosensitive channel
MAKIPSAEELTEPRFAVLCLSVDRDERHLCDPRRKVEGREASTCSDSGLQRNEGARIASPFLTCCRVACAVLLGITLLSMAETAGAQSLGKMKVKVPPKEHSIPTDLTREQVDGYLAGLSDEQARALLAAELKDKTAAKSAKEAREPLVGKETGLILGFFAAQRGLSAVTDRLAGILAGARASGEIQVWEKLTGGRGLDRVLIAMALLILIMVLGWGAERLLLHKPEQARNRLIEEIPHEGWEKASLVLSRLLLDGLGVGVYVLVTFLAHFAIYGHRQPAYLVSSTIVVSYYFRLIAMSARLIVSPRAPELRLVFMADADARFLYRWITWITAAVLPSSALALALQKAGASRELFLFVYSTVGPIIGILLAVMIWQVRERVARAICPLGEPGSIPSWLLRQRCADYWHVPAILLVLTVGGYWWARVLIHADTTILGLILSLFLIPLCIGMDQWLQQILTRLGGKPREVIDFMAPDEKGQAEPEAPMEESLDRRDQASGKDMSIYFPLIRKIFRTVLLIFLFFAALELWGIAFDIGWIFARSVLGVVIALLLGLVVWEIAKARIDQRIREETPFQSDEAEEGGSGGSRSGTLLLLLRKFIMTFLVVVVGFSILASLGVNIAPLLAGAGVVGLAIGFGSQTLVKDIIAGIFFLIDDAFRVGDYVEAGTAKGTVEQISLRSIRLRHPRGQVFVVPFGDLKMVQNFTRDYIIEKLDIRVRFDTDPEEIRKIVKNINKEIRKDEELSHALLGDIKSSGVRTMDDSAMIMRVKFKCVPGEQFIIRRQVYARLQKAFKAKGIEFAHRNVTVYLPPQPATAGQTAGPGGPGAALEAAGAAAAAAIAQAEAEAMAQSTEKKKSD